MVNLVVGETVIDRVTAKYEGEPLEADVVYGGEDEGYLHFANGKWKTAPEEDYKSILNDYMAEMEKSETLDNVINDAPDNKDTAESAEISADGEDAEKDGKQVGRKGILHRIDRKMLIPVLAAAVLGIVILGLLLAQEITRQAAADQARQESMQSEQETESEAICVAVLKHDISLGDTVTSNDFEKTYVDRDTFDQLSRTMYIGYEGTSREGTVILWDYIKKYDNCVAIRDLEAGTVAMADDLSLSKSAITGQMTLRLVAVISSPTVSSGDIVCELGRYVVEAGSLTDILNSQGQSILEGLTEETGRENENTVEETEETEEETEEKTEEPITEIMEETMEAEALEDTDSE